MPRLGTNSPSEHVHLTLRWRLSCVSHAAVTSSLVSTRAMCVEPCAADKEKIYHGTGTEGSGSTAIIVGRHSEPHCDGRAPISKRRCAPDWICSHVITGIASGLPSIVAL